MQMVFHQCLENFSLKKLYRIYVLMCKKLVWLFRQTKPLMTIVKLKNYNTSYDIFSVVKSIEIDLI